MANDLLKDSSDIKFAKLIFNKGTDDALSFNCIIRNFDKEFVNFAGMSDYADQVELGAPVDIKVYSTNGVVAAQATLLRMFKAGETRIYTTTVPVTYEHTQKRAYYRADMHLPVTLIVVLPDGSTKHIKATTKNISGRGMCFISLYETFPEYYSITVNIKFKDRFIVTTADYVYTNPVKYKDSMLYIHAFNFTGIEPQDINFIVRECFLFQVDKQKHK